MCHQRAAHCTDFSNHRCPIIDARSSMPNPSEKSMKVQCAAAGRHIAPTFPLIDAQSPMPNHRCRSSMPNPSEKIWRCKVPPAGGTLHRLFQSSMPNHRCRSSMPNPSDKNMEAHCTNFSTHRNAHSSERPIDGNAIAFPVDRNSRERHCIPNRSE